MDQKCDKEFDGMEEAMDKDKDAQRLAHIAMTVASGTREHHLWLSTSFDEAEVVMNEGPGCFTS